MVGPGQGEVRIKLGRGDAACRGWPVQCGGDGRGMLRMER